MLHTINLHKISVGFFIVLTIIVGLVFLFSNVAISATGAPQIISYQGRLTNASGDLQTGTFYFKFSIYDQSDISGGARLWPINAPTSTPITVSSGVFNVNIGDVANGYPTNLDYNFYDNANVFLQVDVSSDNSSFETLSPRQRIGSAGFAINSNHTATTTLQSAFLQTGLGDCSDPTNSKIYYDLSRGLFICGTDQSGAGTTYSLQNSYNAATSTQEIILTAALGGLTVQDGGSAINANLFEVRGSNGVAQGGLLFAVSATSTKINLGTTITDNATVTQAFAVTNNTVLSGTLNVTGLSTLGNISVGNATTTGLTVQGGSSLGSLVALNSSFSNATSSGGLSVSGGTQLNSLAFTVGTSTSFGVTGGVSFGSLSVTNLSALGNLTAGNATTTGLTVSGGSSLGSLSALNISVSNATTTGLTVQGGSSLGSLSAGNTTLTNATSTSLQVTGGASFGAINIGTGLVINSNGQITTASVGSSSVIFNSIKPVHTNGTFLVAGTNITIASTSESWTINSTASGGSTSLQNAFNAATSSPQIILNSINNGLTIQDSASGLHTALFTVYGQGATSTPFIVMATSTTLINSTFSNATSSGGLSVSGGTQLNSLAFTVGTSTSFGVTGGVSFGSLSVTNLSALGNLTSGNATTTGLTVQGGTSLGSLVAGAATTTSLSVTGGASFGAINVTNNTNLGNATTTGLTVQGGSSLGSISALNISASNATTTGLTVSGGSSLGSLAALNTYINGNLGVASTGPSAVLSVNVSNSNGSTNAFNITTATSSLFYVRSDGYVGLGISSTTSKGFLTINLASSNTGAPYAFNVTTPTSSLFFIGADGRIGIGTTSPGNNLLAIQSTGNVYFGGGLTVSGATQQIGTLTANLASFTSATATQAFAVTNNTVLSGTLNVTGGTSLGNATTTGLTVQGGTNLGSLSAGTATTTSLSVTGGASFGAINVTNLSALGNLTAGNATTTGLTVSGGSSLGSLSALNISVSNATTTGLTVQGGSSLGSLSAGNTTLTNATSTSLQVTGGASFGAINIGGQNFVVNGNGLIASASVNSASIIDNTIRSIDVIGQFLIAGTNVTISSTTDSFTINSTAAGTSGSLQAAYNAATSSPQIVLNSDGQNGLVIQDSGAGLHLPLFSVLGQAGTSTLLTISATSTTFGVGISMQNATTTGLTVQGGSSLGSLVALNSSFSNATSTGGLSVSGGTQLNSLAFTVGTSTSFGVTGGASFGAINVTNLSSLGNITSGNATTTGLTVNGGIQGNSSLDIGNGGLVFNNSNVGIASSTPKSVLSINVSNATGVGQALNITSATSSLLFVRSNGKVGIGTTKPVENLTIVSLGVGDNPAASFMTDPAGSAWTFGLDRSDNWKFKIASSTALGTTDRFVIDGAGNVGIASTSPSAVLSVNVSSATGVTPAFNVTNATGSLLFVRSDGMVGIGTTTPSGRVGQWKLAVQGNIVASGCYSGNASSTGLGKCVDVAESYPVSQTVEVGDIVMLDQDLATHIKLASGTNAAMVLGIVSERPAVLINGSYTAFGGSTPLSFDDNAVPVALVGRVPVKISLENGPIVIGDKISLSSTPGVGKKAKKGETTIGIALEPYDGIQPTEAGIIPKILVFVNLNHPDLTSDQNNSIDSLIQGLTFDSSGNATFRGDIKANNISANTISAIEILANKISALETRIDNIASTTNALSASLNPATSTLGLVIATSTLEIASTSTLQIAITTSTPVTLDFQSTIDAKAGINVDGMAVLNGGLQVDNIGSLGNAINLLNDVTFFGRPYFNNDTGGFAVVSSGAMFVDVTFNREYLEQPIVNATISFDNTDISLPTPEELVFSNDIKYLIIHKSTKGFTIKLNRPAPTDINFSWIALAVKNVKTVISLPISASGGAGTSTSTPSSVGAATTSPIIIEPITSMASTSSPQVTPTITSSTSTTTPITTESVVPSATSTLPVIAEPVPLVATTTP